MAWWEKEWAKIIINNVVKSLPPEYHEISEYYKIGEGQYEVEKLKDDILRSIDKSNSESEEQFVSTKTESEEQFVSTKTESEEQFVSTKTESEEQFVSTKTESEKVTSSQPLLHQTTEPNSSFLLPQLGQSTLIQQPLILVSPLIFLAFYYIFKKFRGKEKIYAKITQGNKLNQTKLELNNYQKQLHQFQIENEQLQIRSKQLVNSKILSLLEAKISKNEGVIREKQNVVEELQTKVQQLEAEMDSLLLGQRLQLQQEQFSK